MITRTPTGWRSGILGCRTGVRLLTERSPTNVVRSRRLALEPDEPRRWLHVARDLYTGFDEQTGVFEQFQGYFELEEIDLAPFTPRNAPMDVLLGREAFGDPKSSSSQTW